MRLFEFNVFSSLKSARRDARLQHDGPAGLSNARGKMQDRPD